MQRPHWKHVQADMRANEGGRMDFDSKDEGGQRWDQRGGGR